MNSEMVFLIKHRVADRDGNEISATYLSQGGTKAECQALIEAESKRFGHHGFDAMNGYWWAWDESDPRIRHRWWMEPPNGSGE